MLKHPRINVEIEEYFSGDPLLHYSVRMEDERLLELLLECPKIDLNQKNDEQMTILELIHLKDDTRSLELVLEKTQLNRI